MEEDEGIRRKVRHSLRIRKPSEPSLPSPTPRKAGRVFPGEGKQLPGRGHRGQRDMGASCGGHPLLSDAGQPRLAAGRGPRGLPHIGDQGGQADAPRALRNRPLARLPDKEREPPFVWRNPTGKQKLVTQGKRSPCRGRALQGALSSGPPGRHYVTLLRHNPAMSVKLRARLLR